MNRRKMEGARVLSQSFWFVVGLLVFMWLASMIPDQPWMFDQTPMCSAGRQPYLDGQMIKCGAP